MSYKVIEKNEYGVRVRNYSAIPDCMLCKNSQKDGKCDRSECAPNSYYLTDYEVEKLESKNEELIKFLEDNIERCKEQENYSKSMAIAMSAENSGSMAIAYQNVLEFIKNQK